MMKFYYFLRKQAVLKKKIKTSFHEVLLNGLKNNEK